MNARLASLSLLAIVALGAGGYGLFRLGLERGAQQAPALPPEASPRVAASTQAGATNSDATLVDPGTGRRVLYWHDPMVPGPRFDKPGKSPFMNMDLVPVYADDAAPAGTIRIDPRQQQNLGIRTAHVMRGPLVRRIEVSGSVAWNERDVAVVQARANGFVERLHVRAPLDPVKRGESLAELYVPEWVAAQEEFLTVRRIGAQAPSGLIDGARQRMRLAGMSDEHIRLVESSGTTHPRLTIAAPIAGVISELSAREGMTVTSGATLFRINGLSTVWINAEVPESLAAEVRPGTTVSATTIALPGEVFRGKVETILPEVTAATRTLKARVHIANPAGRLVPGMFATVEFSRMARSDVLVVPSEAVIRTGTRTLVMLRRDDGTFAPAEVAAGVEADGKTEIRTGLQEGQNVVVSGQFLVDSEASLRGAERRMAEERPPDTATADRGAGRRGDADPNRAGLHDAAGKVQAIDGDEITLSHGAVPSLKWGPMTMAFKTPPAGLPPTIKPGASVTFTFRALPSGDYRIEHIAPDAARGKGAGK